VNAVGSACLGVHFQDQAPEYPTFQVLITSASIGQAAQDALRTVAGQGRTKQASAVLDALEMFDDDGKIDMSACRYAKWILELVRRKGHGQVLNRSEILSDEHGVEYMAPRSFRLEPEWAVVVIAGLVYSGELTLAVGGLPKMGATELPAIAGTPIGDLASFKYVERPKDWNIAGLTAMFELLRLPKGYALEVTRNKNEPVSEMLAAASSIVERILRVTQSVSDGVPFFGKPLLPPDQAARVKDSLTRTKEFLESLQRFTTPGKLKNFSDEPAEIKKHEAGLKTLDDMESLSAWLQSVASVGQYLATAEQVLRPDHEWVAALHEERDALTAKLADPAKRSSQAVRQEVQQTLARLQADYIDAYLKLHGRARLGAEEGRKKGTLFKDEGFLALGKLAEISLLPRQRFEEIRDRLVALKPCHSVTRSEMRSQVLCPECGFRPIAEAVAEPAAKALQKLEEALEDLLDVWTSTLLSNLKGAATQEKLALLKPSERKLVEAFVKSGKLPAEVSDQFVRAVTEALSGLQRVSLKTDDMRAAVSGDGAPALPAEIKKRFETYLDKITRGKDQSKVRIVVE